MSKLTVHEKKTLEASLKKARQINERNRLCIILGHNDGLIPEELAKVLRLSLATVYNYLRDYHTKEKTQHELRGGSASKLSQEQTQELVTHLKERTYLKIK